MIMKLLDENQSSGDTHPCVLISGSIAVEVKTGAAVQPHLYNFFFGPEDNLRPGRPGSISNRRPGDPVRLVANSSLALKELGCGSLNIQH